MLDRTGANPHRLQLELTESLLLQDEAMRDFLVGHGCPICQGRLFSPLLPRDRFEDFMAAHHHKRPITRAAAAEVASISASLWADDMKPASKADGAK